MVATIAALKRTRPKCITNNARLFGRALFNQRGALMITKKLSDISDIMTGLVLSRKEAKPSLINAFKYRRLNLRSITESGLIDDAGFEDYFSVEQIDPQFITKENDIIMRLFEPLSPAIISAKNEGLVVPSQLAIIRVKSEYFQPDYIYYYLSQKNILRFLSQQDIGTAARGIRLSTLSEVGVPMLPLDKQRLVASLAETHQKRKQLYLNLIEQYDLQSANMISNIIGGK